MLSPRRGGGTSERHFFFLYACVPAAASFPRVLIQRGPCWWCCLLALCELSWRAVVMACAKRQNLPFAAKLEIINRVERGEKKSDVAAAYKIPRSTLSTILKNKADIRAKSDKRPGARGARRVRRCRSGRLQMVCGRLVAKHHGVRPYDRAESQGPCFLAWQERFPRQFRLAPTVQRTARHRWQSCYG